MFSYEGEDHMQKLCLFGRGQKIRPKKSLAILMEAPLQLCKRAARYVMASDPICQFLCLPWLPQNQKHLHLPTKNLCYPKYNKDTTHCMPLNR